MAGGGANTLGGMGGTGGSQSVAQPDFSAPPDMSFFRPSVGDPQFYQPIYMPQYQSYSASPFSTFGVASYGTSPMMQQDIMSRGMQTTPYYSYGGGNLGMFGMPSFVTPFNMYARQQNQRRTINPPVDDRRVVQGGPTLDHTFIDLPRVVDNTPVGGGGVGGNFGGGVGGGLGGFGAGGVQPSSDMYTSIGQQMFADLGRGGSYDDFGGRFDGLMAQPQMQSMARAPIVSRSAQARGTPNVMMRRAEGGITDLLSK